ncbi:hypothetical protein GIS00_24695 [Nakamurella sp. YIM 132087]|uniref:Helicase-associated domain-containing protein n=1 Tax=Nakamurella alba TaxID=2665158 RepID=A0A7K1FSP3_9ACTN|nr:hypothetical protein [Nakamurella alba]
MEHGFRPDDQRWTSQLERLVQHVKVHGLPPSTSVGTSADERRLGYWLSTQRREERLGTLADDRRARLDEAVPTWRRHRPIWS